MRENIIAMEKPFEEFFRASGLPECPLGRIGAAGASFPSTGVPGPPAPLRNWPRYAVVLTLGGEARYIDSRWRRRTLLPGDLFILFPGVAHAYGPPKNRTWGQLYFDFEGPVFDLCLQRGILSPGNCFYHLKPLRYWHDRIREVCECVSGAQDQSLVKIAQLLKLLAEITTHRIVQDRASAERGWQTEANQLLTGADPSNSDPHAVATRMHISYDMFRKKFSRLSGMAPGTYRARHLARRACELLHNTELSSKEIAWKLGFTDEFYFSRSFKKAVGISPRAFRQNLHRTHVP